MMSEHRRLDRPHLGTETASQSQGQARPDFDRHSHRLHLGHGRVGGRVHVGAITVVLGDGRNVRSNQVMKASHIGWDSLATESGDDLVVRVGQQLLNGSSSRRRCGRKLGHADGRGGCKERARNAGSTKFAAERDCMHAWPGGNASLHSSIYRRVLGQGELDGVELLHHLPIRPTEGRERRDEGQTQTESEPRAGRKESIPSQYLAAGDP